MMIKAEEQEGLARLSCLVQAAAGAAMKSPVEAADGEEELMDKSGIGKGCVHSSLGLWRAANCLRRLSNL